RTTHAFVRQHRHEPDFTLRIDYEVSDPVVRKCGIPVTDIVFAKWMPVRDEPKYRVAIQNGTVIVLPPGPRPHPIRPGRGL
ncbi:MAG TPA: hypothetical protein VKE74_21195, partial [Gemmataceae bacterium]|nr:hypothetical protein [Gemmataceae bacterium]